MTKSVYIVAAEDLAAKPAVASGALKALRTTYEKVGIFRPIIHTVGRDQLLDNLLAQAEAGQSYESGYGVTYAQMRKDPLDAVTTIIGRYLMLKESCDVVLIIGSDYSDVIGPIEFPINASLAANLNAPTLLVVEARGTPEDLRHTVDFCVLELTQRHTVPMGILALTSEPKQMESFHHALSDIDVPLIAAVAYDGSSEIVMPESFASVVESTVSDVRTPLMFQYELMMKASANKRTIILPESTDDRILTAADITTRRGIANLILLGDEETIRARARQLHLDLDGVRIQNPTDPVLMERFAQEYATLRASKGMTLEKARETLADLSYFATMMIHFGMADGMVSGAIHTTANTIRPSLEFIKTKPGVTLVSGYFLMCLADRVYVFADCAVNTNPTPENLADIAIASATTARSFGIDPRVALLSYSTGTSGVGPDVDAVSEAARILRERAPELPSEGPIQFDAAVDPTVAHTKLPGSAVAGRATVFIFPDLNTGNITYKAVQRTANALAVGPILQGLRKPVNDLSRGALIDDIVNTIAITAIQAQEDAA